jgi:hypothetical protein
VVHERAPAVDLAYGDLAGRQQCPQEMAAASTECNSATCNAVVYLANGQCEPAMSLGDSGRTYTPCRTSVPARRLVNPPSLAMASAPP